MEIQGNKLISSAALRRAIGTLPGRLDEAVARVALAKALSHCRSQGYRWARGWVVGPLGNKTAPRYRLVIDEGYIDRLAFVGANTLRILMLRVEVYLPKKIFHAPTMKRILRRLRKKYRLKRAFVRRLDIGPEMRAADGSRAPRRELRLYFVSRQLEGWGLGVSLSSTYGVVPRISYSERDTFFDTDRLSASLGIAFPYRQYLFTESPAFSWVHGFLRGRYRLPRLASGHLAPALAGEYSISRLQRADLDPALDRYLLNRGELLGQLEITVNSTLSFELGLGWQNITIWDIETPETTPDDAYRALSINAFVGQLQTKLLAGEGPGRRDLRTELIASVRTEIADEQWLVRGELEAQFGACLGYHCLLLRGLGTLMLGEVRYWNQRPLADHLRVFFDNRFWIQEALSVSGALRFGLYRDNVQLGIYHDLALFGDRRDPNDTHTSLANAFGPSLHFLILDVFSLDIYYGFGFAPGGFDHNLSFSLQRVF